MAVLPVITGTSGNDVLNSGDEAAIVRGLAGDDILFGGGGDDWLEGGDGFDQLDGGTGSDTVYGGMGDDVFFDDDEFGGGGNDQFFGEDGWDSLHINRRGLSAPAQVLIDGGGGPDVITFSGHTFLDDATLLGGGGDDTINAFYGHTVIIDAGTGDDRVALYFLGAVTTVTLGSGKDFLALNAYLGAPPAPGGGITVTDFETGAAGDRLELLGYLVDRLTNWDPAANPFATHLRLVQDGADTLLQLDSDGPGAAAAFATLLRLQNVQIGALGVYNLGGYAGDGSAPVPATVLGTAGLDQLWGTGGNDLIQGLGSQDEIFGGGGNDRIEGGDGNDLLYGQYGDDQLFGEAGTDNLIDQEGGNDQFFGGAERDYLVVLRKDAIPLSDVLLDGGDGDDRLDFNALNRTDSATITGGDGDDEIYVVGNGQIAIDGGAGADLVQINYANAHVALTLGAGADRVNIKADAGYGAGLALVFNDFAAGGAGDVLDLSAYLTRWLQNWNGTANPFDAGYLRLVQSAADTLLILDRDGVVGSGDAWTLATFHNLSAGTLTAFNLGYAPGPIAFLGTTGGDVLNGDAGANRIDGLGGDDVINGGQGADTMAGGQGNDTIFVDNVGDAIVELANEGYDVVPAAVSYTLTAGAHVELMTTGWIEGTALIDLTGNELDQQIWGNAAANLISGADGDDTLFGFGGSDTLVGGNGKDVFFGGAGANDTLQGGLGDDTYFADDAGDVLVEAADEGRDVAASSVDYALGAGVSVELMTTGWIGGTVILALTGNELGNEIWGNDGVNALNGAAGSDALFGFGGSDRLDGAAGLDLLVGGTGQDSFVFANAPNSAEADIVADFSSVDDTILLDDAVFAGLGLGALSANAFVAGTAALDADDRILYDASTGKLYFDADGNGAGAAIQFAILSGNPALTAGDFMVI